MKLVVVLTAHPARLGVKLDTNGSNSNMIEALLRDGMVDCIAMDVKAPLDEVSYARLTGGAVDLTAIRRSIRLIGSNSVEAIFRMTVVPTLITEEDICRVARAIAPAQKLVLQQFSPKTTLDLSLRSLVPWSPARLEEAQGKVNEIIQAET